MKVRVICIDDKFRPQEIPPSKWPKENSEYHITWIYNQMQQKGILGCELAEFDISDCLPYNCYNLNRFAIHKEDIELFMQLAKDSAQLNEIELVDILHEIEHNSAKE